MRILLLSALVALAGSLPARWLDADFHAGATTLSMGEVNAANAAAQGWNGTGHAGRLDQAFIAGVDLGTARLTPWPWLKLGLRGEYLLGGPAEMSSHFSVNSLVYTDTATLSSGFVGATVEAPFLARRLRAGLSAWVGAGYATLSQTVGLVQNGAAIPSGLYFGWTPVEELEAHLRLHLIGTLGLEARGGWRWAAAGELHDGAGTPFYDTLNQWIFSRKVAVGTDYSGATAQGGLVLDF